MAKAKLQRSFDNESTGVRGGEVALRGTMNEANVDLAELGSVEQREPAAAFPKPHEEERIVSRLPPVPFPPHMASSRPVSHAPSAAPMLPPAPAEPAVPNPEVHPPPHSSTSWWQSLLTTTQPPTPAVVASASDVRRPGSVAVACALLGIGLLAFGIAVGLWEGSIPGPPIVAAATVIGRALVSLGVLAFGLSLLGIAERLSGRAR